MIDNFSSLQITRLPNYRLEIRDNVWGSIRSDLWNSDRFDLWRYFDIDGDIYALHRGIERKIEGLIRE